MSAMASIRGIAVRNVPDTQRPVVRSKWAPSERGNISYQAPA